MSATYRRGTTVVVFAGPSAGVIGKTTGSGAGTIYVEQAFGPNRKLVVADAGDVMKAPHPLGWYDRVQGRHSCEGCDELEAAKARRSSRRGELVTRTLDDGDRDEMTLDAALAWLHSHGYAEDVTIAADYLRDGGTIRTMSSSWTLVSESEARVLDGNR